MVEAHRDDEICLLDDVLCERPAPMCAHVEALGEQIGRHLRRHEIVALRRAGRGDHEVRPPGAQRVFRGEAAKYVAGADEDYPAVQR